MLLSAPTSGDSKRALYNFSLRNIVFFSSIWFSLKDKVFLFKGFIRGCITGLRVSAQLYGFA